MMAPEAGMVTRRTPPSLSGLVRKITVYRERSDQPTDQRECVALVVPLIFGFATPFRIALGRPPTQCESFTSFTAGLCR